MSADFVSLATQLGQATTELSQIVMSKSAQRNQRPLSGATKIKLKGVPPADENGDIGTSDRVGQDESVGTNYLHFHQRQVHP